LVQASGPDRIGLGLGRLYQDELSEATRTLVADHITSVEQLEILLLVRGEPGKEWSARAVSEAMRTSESSAAMRLKDLSARGLLSQEGSPPRYRYAPNSGALARGVDELARAYAERRYTVIELIFSKPIDKLRVYAEAFRVSRYPGRNGASSDGDEEDGSG
jgi:hypothetical protein